MSSSVASGLRHSKEHLNGILFR